MIRLRSVVASLLQLAGIVVMALGAWSLAPWVGMLVAGLGVFAVGAAVEP